MRGVGDGLAAHWEDGVTEDFIPLPIAFVPWQPGVFTSDVAFVDGFRQECNFSIDVPDDFSRCVSSTRGWTATTDFPVPGPPSTMSTCLPCVVARSASCESRFIDDLLAVDHDEFFIALQE